MSQLCDKVNEYSISVIFIYLWDDFVGSATFRADFQVHISILQDQIMVEGMRPVKPF